MSEYPGFVYFVTPEEGGLVKIGYSKNPVARLDGLMLWSPIHLVCLATYPAYPRDEAVAHDTFWRERVRGEWFSRSDGMMAMIAEIAAGKSGPRVEWENVFPGNTISAIKDYRERIGLSPEGFASICDVSPEQIARWEFGPTQVCAVARILRVLPALGYDVSIHDLYRRRAA